MFLESRSEFFVYQDLDGPAPRVAMYGDEDDAEYADLAAEVLIFFVQTILKWKICMKFIISKYIF